MKQLNYSDITKTVLNTKIYKCLNEVNMFWWGCVLGLQYGKIDTIRVSENEQPNDHGFTPIVRIKYSSAYENNPGKIVLWYDKVFEKQYNEQKPNP